MTGREPDSAPVAAIRTPRNALTYSTVVGMAFTPMGPTAVGLSERFHIAFSVPKPRKSADHFQNKMEK
jgi:hypothetical protein